MKVVQGLRSYGVRKREEGGEKRRKNNVSLLLGGGLAAREGHGISQYPEH